MVVGLLVLPQKRLQAKSHAPSPHMTQKEESTQKEHRFPRAKGKRLHGSAGPEQTQSQANPNKREFLLKREFLASRHGYDSETIYMMMKEK